MNRQWYILESAKDYQEAIERFRRIDGAQKGTSEYKEMLLLVLLINQYEIKQWDLPGVDPIKIIKMRMKDFGYSAADLAKEYGDKGTISKVLNYKQPLSLTMIRLFSKMLRISADALTKKYKLQS